MDHLASKKFSFVSTSLPADTFGVVSFKGSERISTPYQFEIVLISDNLGIDFKAVMDRKATLVLHREGGGDVQYHGVVANFEQLHEVDGYAFYHARLVPRFWWLSVIQHNQVFLNESVQDFAKAILKDGGLLEGTDFEFHLQGTYDPIEYVCQYGETHLNFLSRWCEREGIYYYFEQTEDCEKIIFTDTLIAHTDPPSGGNVVYSPPTALESSHLSEAIRSFRCHKNVLPAKVLLKDYNYRRPSLELAGTADIDENGRGTVYYYHEHFRTSEEGNRLAKTRAESIRCTGEEYYGESSVPSMEPGFTFTLTKHYRNDFDQKYLTTEVIHEGDQSGLLPVGTSGGPGEGPAYYINQFTAIPASTQFRQQVLTKRPMVSGSVLAKVDAGGSGQYAELDDMGRYKVIIPFDVSGRKDGKASSWIRMAQPYAGSGHGMHFPLHKGTEVLLTFVNGDPDRPIIAAAIPNPSTPSPVTTENQTSNIIHTAGGNKIHMGDQEGSQHMVFQSPTAGSKIRIGAPSSTSAGGAPKAAAAPLAGSLPPPPEIGTWIDQHKDEINAYRQAIRQYWIENNPDKVAALKEAKEKWQQTKDGYQKAKEQWQQAEDGYNKAKEQLEQLKEKLGQLKEQGGAAYQKLEEQWQQAEAAYQNAQDQWRQAVKAYQNAEEQWQKAKQQGGAAYQKAQEQWQQAEAAYQNAQYQWQQAQMAYQKAKEQWQQAGEGYEKAKENYEKAVENYDTAKGNYEKAVENYEKAVENYAKAEEGYQEAKTEFQDMKEEQEEEDENEGIELCTKKFFDVSAQFKNEIIMGDVNEVVLGGVGDICVGGRLILSMVAYSDITLGVKHEYQWPKRMLFKGIQREVSIEHHEKHEQQTSLNAVETRIVNTLNSVITQGQLVTATSIRQNVDALNTSIAQKTQQIADLKATVLQSKQTITTLTETIARHQVEIEEQTKRVNTQVRQINQSVDTINEKYETVNQDVHDLAEFVARGAMAQHQFTQILLG